MFALIREYSYKNIRFNSLQNFASKQSEPTNKIFASTSSSLQNIHFHLSVPLSLFMSVSVSVSMYCVGGHGHAAWMQTNNTCMHIQRGLGHDAWTWTIGHTMDICSVDMDMDMQHEHEHEHGHAAWTWTCSMNMGLDDWIGYAACTWAVAWHGLQHGHTYVDIQHGHGHFFSMDINLQHGLEYALMTRTYRMNMEMQHGHGHAAWI
jgi:hypothetical protein